MSDSLWQHRLYSARSLCPWDSPGKNTGVDCHFLLQWIFLTQGSNPSLLGLLHWLVDGFFTTTPPGKLPKIIALVIKKHPTKKSPWPNGFTSELCQMFKDELHQSFTNSKRRKHFLSILLNQTCHKKLQANVPDEYKCENSQQKNSKPNPGM